MNVPELPLVLPMRTPKAAPPTEPSNTLYVRNLNEKKSLKAILSALKNTFGQYGKVVDIIANKTIRMRGQAFVIFQNLDHALNAKKELQGFPLFSKPMDVQFSRNASFVIAESQGTLEQAKRKREELKNVQENRKKRALGDHSKTSISASKHEYVPPNRILYLQNLPDIATQEVLMSLFQRFPGFVEIRMVPGKKDIAFVEYLDESQASVAKQALHGYRLIPEEEIRVSYARK